MDGKDFLDVNPPLHVVGDLQFLVYGLSSDLVSVEVAA